MAKKAKIEMPDAPPLICPDCGGDMYLRRTEKFGGRYFYGCENFPRCKAAHGAHPDGTPLGVPASHDTKQARIAAHDAFDRLWKRAHKLPCYQIDRKDTRAKRTIQRAARRRAYLWLAAQLKITTDDCHIGQFDKETCEKVVELCSGTDAMEIRTWARLREMSDQDRYDAVTVTGSGRQV